jgi:hypothetical protein
MHAVTTTIAVSVHHLAAHLRAYNRVTCDLRTEPLAALERKIFSVRVSHERAMNIEFFRVSHGRASTLGYGVFVFTVALSSHERPSPTPGALHHPECSRR